MFPKETPPPHRYERKKHYPVIEEDHEPRMTKIVMWGIIILGVLFIIWAIFFSPREKHLVCSPMPVGLNSLVTFGTCKEE